MDKINALPEKSLTLNSLLQGLSNGYMLQIQEALNFIAQGNQNQLFFQPLLGGLSNAKIFSFAINNKQYVLRLLDEAESIDIRQSELAAHQIGAQLKIAPQLFYFKQSNPLVFVIEFIDGQLFSQKDLDNPIIVKKLMETIRKFHNTVPPVALYQKTKLTFINEKIADNKIKNYTIFPSCFDPLHQQLQETCISIETKSLPCHGDLNPENIIIGKDGNIYLLDWAQANMDHPFIDIGWLACFSAATNNHITILLQEYLERQPTATEVLEMILLKNIILFHTTIFWFSQQKETDQKKLDHLLSQQLKNNNDNISDLIITKDNPLKPETDITIHSLRWLKQFIQNRELYKTLVAFNDPKQFNLCCETISEQIKTQRKQGKIPESRYPFIIMLGASGAGKTTIVKQLKKLDSRIVYIKPYTTRPLRQDETDKISVSLDELTLLSKQEQLLERQGNMTDIDNCYGACYGTPITPIQTALANGQIPVLDFPISKIEEVQRIFGESLFCVYVVPPNLATLQKRLAADGRDKEGKRFQGAIEELNLFAQGTFNHIIDKVIISYDGCIESYAQEILDEIGGVKTKRISFKTWSPYRVLSKLIQAHIHSGFIKNEASIKTELCK